MVSTHKLYEIYQEYPVISTDSRKVPANSLFFALKGSNFDGNEFAANALKKGAAFAVVDRPDIVVDNRFLLVENVLTALQDLARHHRLQFDIPVLAITGSNGKTTTKELVFAVLNQRYSVHATRGNFNNHIGVPLTLLDMPQNTEIAIIEMGANHRGEIANLCELALPTHGIVTNIGKAHLEGFGSLDGIKKAKAELFDFLARNDGLAFVNVNEKYLKQLSQHVGRRILYKKWEENPGEEVFAAVTPLSLLPFVGAGFQDGRGEFIETESHLFGDYNFENIMTGIVAGLFFQVPGPMIKRAIESYVPRNNRSQVLRKNSITFILDAYNANPTSMRKALENFASLAGVRKIAILGDMLELGAESDAEHRAIVDFSLDCGFEKLMLVGKEFGKVPIPSGVLWYPNVQKAKQWFSKQDFSNCYILIKGSRGIRLEEIIGE